MTIEIHLASIAHNALTALFYTCPPNYTCGGPAYGAWNTIDSILTLMGIGVPMLKRGVDFDSTKYQEAVRKNAVTKGGVISGYIQHKSQIISEALRSTVYDFREGDFREPPAITEKALLQVLQWFCQTAKVDPKKLADRLLTEVHDELIQNEPEGLKHE